VIIDTTYLLPLARISVKTDILRAIADGRAKLSFDELKVSLISLFELQAKASKLDISPEHVFRAISVIFRSFYVVPFYELKVIRIAHELKDVLGDYIDRIIVASAVALREDLLTEDRDIHDSKGFIEEKYGVKVYRYSDFAQT